MTDKSHNMTDTERNKNRRLTANVTMTDRPTAQDWENGGFDLNILSYPGTHCIAPVKCCQSNDYISHEFAE